MANRHLIAHGKNSVCASARLLVAVAGEDFVHRGTVQVTLGDSIRQAEAGGLVFIPRGTWIGFRVQGPDTATIVSMFNTPGFEKCLRFLSAPYGKVFVRPSAAAIATARENCHQVPRPHPLQ